MKKTITKWILLRALISIAIICFMLAETNTGGDRSEIQSEKARRINESPSGGLANTSLPRNLTDAKFSYGKRTHFRGSAEDHTVLISQQAVYRTVEELKERIALPFDIQILFEE